MKFPPAGDAAERRARQRFLGQRRGEACFWMTVGEARVPLVDISLEGFALPPVAGASAEGFDFVMQRSDVPDRIAGRAVVVGGHGAARPLGCRFVDLPADDRQKLQDWLVAHVIMSATVRITEKDATAIVTGRSLV